MKTDEQIADDILARTLIEVRSARTKRRAVKGAFAICAMVTLVIVLIQRPARVPATGPVAAVESVRPTSPSVDESIVVMVWKDGTPRLEWIRSRDLGTVELQFNLDPVFAFADEG